MSGNAAPQTLSLIPTALPEAGKSDILRIMESKISATEAARRFSDIVNRVAYRYEEFVVERGGEAVCRIVPAGPRRFTVTELADLLAIIRQPDAAFWDDVDALAKGQPSVPEPSW
jgi:antitoxin (DNA-binding transcriptional repressor) of toxin-antitoxin stability system